MNAVELLVPVMGSVVGFKAGVSLEGAQPSDLSLTKTSLLASQNEKTQSKHRSNSNAKRGDKRNGKVPKSNFLLKNGLVSFNSTSGGNNFLGVYGLKRDPSDVTQQAEELSLTELLDGSYNRPYLDKDKGKKSSDSNENLLQLVRKAFSVLRPQKPVDAQYCAEVDINFNPKVSTGIPCMESSLPNVNEDEKGDTCGSNLMPNDKALKCREMAQPQVVVDPSLSSPKDILGHLALPPSKDLDSLLLDAARPPASSRSAAETRVGKPVTTRTGLPPFSWSHNYSGHHKSGSDSAKLLTSRASCQGRWVRVGNHFPHLEGSTGFHQDLESLTYDQSLVPLGCLVPGPSENGNEPLILDYAPSERISPTSVACSTSQDIVVDRSPRILAAAQILSEMASASPRPHGTIKSPNRNFKKPEKSCKLKSGEKSNKPFLEPKPKLKRADEATTASKKPRLLTDANRADVGRTDSDVKGLVPWSAPRSVRSSPGKFSRDPVMQSKNCGSTVVVNKSFVMPPPREKVYSNQQRVRNAVSREWNRAGSKVE